jgi:hypothetical protein
MAVLAAHLHEPPPPLRSLCPEVSPEFEAVVHRALAKRPADRFRNADEMRAALQAAVEARAATLVLDLPAAAPAAEPPAEVTGELEIARRVDFPLVQAPPRRDPRRALLPGAIVAIAALAVIFAASKLHPPEPADVEEQEPNDAPALVSGAARYPQWRRLGMLNAIAEGRPVRATAGGGDVDVFAVESRRAGEVPDAILLVPATGLALSASGWAPGASDLDGGGDPSERFEPMTTGDPGQPILARLPGSPSPDAPVLVRVAAARGQGTYRVLALGPDAVSGRAVLGVMRALAADGRADDALLVAAAFVHLEPGSPGRADVLALGARLVEGGGKEKEKGAGPGRPTP